MNKKQLSIFMNYAFSEAKKAYKLDEVPIGAIVVLNNQIIGKGYNQCEALSDPTAHAEMIAITAAANTLGDWRLEEGILFVTKEPCAMCAGAILNSRLKMIVFGCYDNDAGCCGSIYNLCGDPILNNTIIVKGGILEDTCRDILNAFFLEKRN
ncbi:MAG TPA: nucleoside deaminase [Candidatus Marinimicrobia bacterium]|nr:nucleoside deaminase [Candidatus Neomarinimicrobiota bacterium]